MPDIRQPPWRPSRPVIFGTLVAMLVLSGLDRLDARVGASVAAGDAVGAMGAAPRPRLTMELRHDGRPVDPGPWLSARG